MTRPGQDGLTAAEANERGRELFSRNEFPAREEKWDFMMPEHIDAIDGTHEQLRLPILSGSEAVDCINSVQGSVPAGSESECNCSERHSRWSESGDLPEVTEDGICLGCGCCR